MSLSTLISFIRSRPRTFALGTLAGIIFFNFLLTYFLFNLPGHAYSWLAYFYKDSFDTVFHEWPLWRLLLPIPQWTGAWAPTGFITVYATEVLLGPLLSFIVLDGLSIGLTYFISYYFFRSYIYSIFISTLVAISSHNDYVYVVQGSKFVFLFILYIQILMYAHLKILSCPPNELLKWWAAYALGLILTALAYEGWLAYPVFVLIGTSLSLPVLRKHGETMIAHRALTCAAVSTVTMLAYVTVKITMGFGNKPGAESELIFYYQNISPMILDVISNLITYIYVVAANFLPSEITSSYALNTLGRDILVEEMTGYHMPYSEMVYHHHIFYWRYLAGALIAGLLYSMIRVYRVAWDSGNLTYLLVFLLLLMLALGSPTHALIKWRPMHLEPFLGYKATFAIMASFILIAMAFAHWWRVTKRPGVFTAASATFLVYMVYIALSRPTVMSLISERVGMGTIPQPFVRIQSFFSVFFE